MIIDSIKRFFSKKRKGEPTEETPQGVCPNCWGKQEYDGEFFEIIRDPHFTEEGQRYTSFIQKVVDNHKDLAHVHGNKYVCDTCQTSFE